MMLCSYFLTHPFAPPISWPDQLKFACYGPVVLVLGKESRKDSAVCDSQVAKLSIPVKSRLYLEHRPYSEPIYLASALPYSSA